MIYKNKLIEVSLPLEAINKEAAREKFIRHGHPSHTASVVGATTAGGPPTMPFASLVDDSAGLRHTFSYPRATKNTP